MSNFNDGKPMNKDDANRVFWKEVYPAMFCNMNHFKEANKILDNGSIVGDFLDAVYKVHATKVTNAEAVMGFASWLTTRDEVITASYRHDASPWANAAGRFNDVNGFDEFTRNYPDNLMFPKDTEVNYDNEQKETIVTTEKSYEEDPAMPIITPSKMNIFMSWINKFAMKIVVYNIRNDKDYRRSWTSSITMAQYDSKDPVSGSELFIDWLTR